MISHIQPVPCVLAGIGDRGGERGGVWWGGTCRATASHVTEASVEATPPQVVGDDDVGDGVEHHLDVSRVCGAGHVTVDLLVGRAVLALKLGLDVSRRVVVGVGPCSEGEKKTSPEGTLTSSQGSWCGRRSAPPVSERYTSFPPRAYGMLYGGVSQLAGRNAEVGVDAELHLGQNAGLASSSCSKS